MKLLAQCFSLPHAYFFHPLSTYPYTILHNILNEDTRKKMEKNLTGCGKYNYMFSSRNRKGTVRSSFLLFRDVFPLGWMEERERDPTPICFPYTTENVHPSGKAFSHRVVSPCVRSSKDYHYRAGRVVSRIERQSRKEAEYTLFLLEYK